MSENDEGVDEEYSDSDGYSWTIIPNSNKRREPLVLIPLTDEDVKNMSYHIPIIPVKYI